MKVTVIWFLVCCCFCFNGVLGQTPGSPLKDIDGNVYQTVVIGDQIWMQTNLMVEHFCNGEPILTGADTVIWTNLEYPMMAEINGDKVLAKKYGYLYNHYTVKDVRQLCPVGWKVPSDYDWDKLTSVLGGNLVAGGKLKSSVGWGENGVKGQNTVNFLAIPGGYRYANAMSGLDGMVGFWWSSDLFETGRGWARYINWNGDQLYRANYELGCGFSVRCVKSN